MQQQDSSSLIDASSIDLTVMGSMMGGGRGEQGGWKGSREGGGQNFGKGGGNTTQQVGSLQ